ncbi:PAS domain S-box protein [Pararhizobium arenae]|uniref:PAS domain S-box protein n=1 Tax=Pararhizobium arenae TaxID=1856850 RepID=UPI00094ABCB9|nr:PAS domain S-box protein [Pararhizobium arenae]
MTIIGYLGDEAGEATVRQATLFATLTVDVLPEGIPASAYDVVIIGALDPGALGTARLILASQPQTQIIFLVPPDRLDRFRESLPFIPRLAAAWTVDATVPPRALAEVIMKAAKTAGRRNSMTALRNQINQRVTINPSVSEARRAEEVRLRQLALSQVYLATLLAQAPDAFIALSLDGRITAWNDAAERLFGREAASAIGQTPFDYVSAEVAFVLRDILHLGGEGESGSGREVNIARKGTERWLELSFAPIRDPEGVVVGVSLTAHDVTERKSGELRLSQSERRLRTLTETLPQLVWTAKPDGLCDYFSPQWVAFTGIAEQEQLGLRWLELVIHPDDRERTRDHWLGALEGRHSYDIDYRIRRNDGLYRWFKTRGTPIHNDAGETTQWFGTCTDIEEIVEARELLQTNAELLEQRVHEETAKRSEAERALRQAQKMEAIGQLTGGVAHDFNNLLQVVSGNLQLLSKDVVGLPSAARRIANALAAVQRGSKLASQLLAFGRKQALDPKVVNIGRFVADMEDMLQRTLGETIEIETVRGGGLWNTLVDPTQVENALLNLPINARDAMDGSGKLTIEVGNAFLDDSYASDHQEVAAGQYVLVAVTDTGSGIPLDIIEKVFEPFFTTKPIGKGTGLGLSMVYGFVKQSGGHIKIYSEVGEGTTIKLYFPRSLEEEDALVVNDHGPVVGGSETILVAEDDEQVRATVVELLTDLGYKVLKAKDAASALTVIESGIPVDLLFTDVVMPGPLKSADLARKAVERVPDLAVLFTSGYTENSIVHGGRLDAGVELLSKPYARETMARKIRHVLNNRTQRMEARQRLAQTSPAIPAVRQLPRAKILLVEDDMLIRMSTTDMLEDLEQDVEEVGLAEEAIALLERQDFDVLITDMGLPGMSGDEFCAIVRERWPGIAIVFATGRNEGPLLSDMARTALLLKPFGVDELRTALTSLTLAPGARQE